MNINMTKEEFLSEVKALEDEAFDVIARGEEEESPQFEETIRKAETLIEHGKKQGWIKV